MGVGVGGQRGPQENIKEKWGRADSLTKGARCFLFGKQDDYKMSGVGVWNCARVT